MVAIRFGTITDASGGSSSVGRAAAFQAACREFEPRLPLHTPHLNHPAEPRPLRTGFASASDGVRSPGLVRVREPDQLGVERADQLLAFGLRFIELAEPDRQVAGDRRSDARRSRRRPPACRRVARRRNESDPGQQLELAIDRHVLHAGRIDPLANGVVVLAARVVELPTLNVDRLAGEEAVAAAMVEVQVGVDDDVDAGEVEVLFAQRASRGSMSATKGCSSVMPVSTRTRPSGWSMTCT